MSTTFPVPDVADEAPAQESGLNLHHRAMYYVFRPVVKRLPVGVFAALAMLAAIPIGTLQAFRRGGYYRRILQSCGRGDGLLARVRLAVRSVYAKARHLDWYIYESTPHLHATWDGPPESQPCVYFLANTYGSEAVANWMDRYPSVMVRRTFAGEGEIDPATATPDQMWRAHQAKLREHSAQGRQVVVGDNPMAYRKLFAGRQSVIIYQDLWDPKKPGGPMLLGSAVTLNTGSLRIAKLAGGLPLRFMTVRPQGSRWHVHVGPRIEPSYVALAAAIEGAIRSHPAEWMLWQEWFEFIDSRRAG